MKKRIIVFCLASVLMLCMVILVNAEEQRPVYVMLDGAMVDCEAYGQPPVIVEGRTMVPLRAIFESLGADVIWDRETRTVISARNGIVVSLEIGSNVLYKNDYGVTIDVPAFISNGRTLVPARAIAESFGVAVEWDQNTRTVILTTVDGFTQSTNPHELDSSAFGKTAYGKYNFGMTMQECWDVAEGEKKVASFADRNELHVKETLPDATIESAKIKSTRLLFVKDYLYSLIVETEAQDALQLEKDYENAEGTFVDVNKSDSDDDDVVIQVTDGKVETAIDGYRVSEDAIKTAENFLGLFVKFDMSRAAALCTSQNSIKWMGISSAKDVVSYMGYDKKATVDAIVAETYKGDENYRIIAEAITDPTEETLIKCLEKCTYVVEEIKGVSETEAMVVFTVVGPDAVSVIENGTEKFETAFTEVLTAKINDGSLKLFEMNQLQAIRACAPIIEETFEESMALALEESDDETDLFRKTINVVLVDGKWKVNANDETIKSLLSGFEKFIAITHR